MRRSTIIQCNSKRGWKYWSVSIKSFSFNKTNIRKCLFVHTFLQVLGLFPNQRQCCSCSSNKAVIPPLAVTCNLSVSNTPLKRKGTDRPSIWMNWLARGCATSSSASFFSLANAFKSSNIDLHHCIQVPYPQKLQKLITLSLQSWKHHWFSTELLFNFSTFSHFPQIPVRAENTTYRILLLQRILSVTVNKILQIIFKTVTSLTFLKLFYRLCCCLVMLIDTCKFSILRESLLSHTFANFQICDSF